MMFNRGLHSITYVFAVSLIPAWASLYLKTDKLAHSTSSIAANEEDGGCIVSGIVSTAPEVVFSVGGSHNVGGNVFKQIYCCDAFFPASNLGPHGQSAIVMVAVHKRDNVNIHAELITGGSQPC